ncbi:hypothetical protein QJU50_04705 [Pasteurella atlantica]|nr:hypothetical protein [Pasteurella atlantica]MDP8041684.1 hypothetical protein [Pasteurella atlantica]MDP8142370.1 hypothetical protein [Pasteurella atlantica]MDP8166566.1 hypothetical protein [Pasteurella atlantica]
MRRTNTALLLIILAEISVQESQAKIQQTKIKKIIINPLRKTFNPEISGLNV